MKIVALGLMATVFFVAVPVLRAGDNILQNGGAEEGDKSPKGWSQGAEVGGVEYIWDKKARQQGKATFASRKPPSGTSLSRSGIRW